MTTLEGILERITFHSEQDGYTVARVQPRDKSYLVTIVGKLLGVQVGESLELEGRWVDHPEHGRQFEVERFRSRKLEGSYPYLWVDATFLKVRAGGRVVSMAVVIAVGVNAEGQREILGLDVGPSEDGAFWLLPYWMARYHGYL